MAQVLNFMAHPPWMQYFPAHFDLQRFPLEVYLTGDETPSQYHGSKRPNPPLAAEIQGLKPL